MSKINPDFAHDAYRFLIQSVRDQDADGLLERIFTRYQYWMEQAFSDTERLLTLLDPSDCPEEALSYLKTIVGWSDDLDYITDRISVADLRKLIALSAELWKLKGTEGGIKAAVRLFSGREAVIENWFFYRWIVGETGVFWEYNGADSWSVGGVLTDLDEYLSSLLIMDEGNLDYQLIHDIVELVRPSKEHYDIVYLDFLDDFHQDMAKWGAPDVLGVGATAMSSVIDVATATLTITPAGGGTAAGVAADTVLSSSWLPDRDVLLLLTPGAIGAGTRYHITAIYNAAGDRIDLILDPSGLTWSIEVRDAAVITDSAAGALPATAFLDGVKTHIRVRIMRLCSNDFVITVWLNNELLTTQTLNTPAWMNPGGGTFQIVVIDPALTQVTLDTVRMWTDPLYVDHVPGDLVAEPSPLSLTGTCIFFDEDFETGLPNANFPTATGLWHAAAFRTRSGVLAAYYGQNEVGIAPAGTPGEYNTGGATVGILESKDLDFTVLAVPPAEILLEWWQYGDLEDGADPARDRAQAELSLGGAPSFQMWPKSTIMPTGSTSGLWSRYRLDITAFALGIPNLRVRFRFNSVDGVNNTTEGWYIDSVRILVR